MPAEPVGRTDPVSLGGGIGLVTLGLLLLLDQTGALELTFGWLGAIVSAVVGTILLISGLRDPVAPRAPAAARPTIARGAHG